MRRYFIRIATSLVIMPSNIAITIYQFEKKFQIQITAQESRKQSPPIQAELVWYTGGLKTAFIT